MERGKDLFNATHVSVRILIGRAIDQGGRIDSGTTTWAVEVFCAVGGDGRATNRSQIGRTFAWIVLGGGEKDNREKEDNAWKEVMLHDIKR